MPAIVRTGIAVQCDGPKCSDQVHWIQQEVEKDESVLSDNFYRIMKLNVWDEKQKQHVDYVFTSVRCLQKFLKDYFDPRSPKELDALTARNEAVDRAKKEKQLEIPFNPPVHGPASADSGGDPAGGDYRVQPDGFGSAPERELEFPTSSHS